MTRKNKTPEEELAAARAHLLMAQAALKFMREAQHTAITHGIDYRTTREGKEEGEHILLIKDMGLERGSMMLVHYYEMATSGLRAAVRRKGLTSLPGGA